MRDIILKILLIIFFTAFVSNRLYAQENDQEIQANKEIPDSTEQKTVYFTFRLGQGGFSDSRSELGKLGGGQVVLDIKPAKLPVIISLLSEYYTNSADPSHSYEIAAYNAINISYTKNFFSLRRTDFFIGGGLGQAIVPRDDSDSRMVRDIAYNVEAGIQTMVIWKIGAYVVGKYLYANKKKNGVQLIDFSEYILLLGLTFNFSF